MTGPVETVEPLVCNLYDPDGGFNRVLTNKIAAGYQDQNSDPGSGTLVMLVSDADTSQVVPLSMVKYELFGEEKFGVRVGREDGTYDEADCTITWSCMGLLGAILSDSLVLDESGSIRAQSTGQRWVGWMSSGYDDTVTGWITTLAASSFVWTDESQSAARLGNPVDWPDPLAWWVHRGSFGGQFQLWRRSFTTASDAVLRLWASADEGIRVYFDGELVLDTLGSNAPNETGFIDSNPTDLGIVNAGDHHVAFEFRSKITPILGDSFDGAILTIGTVDIDNNYLTNVVRTDDSGVWRSYGGTWEQTRPGMSIGAAMLMLWDEAVARGVHGPALCATPGFTADVDSNSVAWDASLQINEAVDLVNQGLDLIFLAWADGRIDVWFDAATMVLHAAQRRGTDRRATVSLKKGTGAEIAAGANITQLTTSRDVQIANVLYGQLSDQTYTMVADSASSATYGLIERSTSLGNTTAGSGRDQLAVILAQITDPEETAQVTQALWGAVPYQDYFMGDTVTGPRHRQSPGPVRTLGFSVDQPAGADYADMFPALMPDPT